MARTLSWAFASALLLATIDCAPAASTRAAEPRVPGVDAVAQCRPLTGPFSALELVVLGSGGPSSSGRAASSYAVFVDGVPRILVDVGPGAFVRLAELGIGLAALDTVLLTHLHIDHSGDLPGFVKSRDLGSDEPLTFNVFGPTGAGAYPSTTVLVDRLFGTNGAFAYLKGFRNELHFAVTDLPATPALPIHEVIARESLRVTSIAVDHDDAPAVAYRIEHAGHALVVSGDLATKNDNLSRLAAGADLLVYDASVVDPPGSPKGLYDLHTAPHRIGEVAAGARVRSLLLSHISQAVERDQDGVARSIRMAFAGQTGFARDCMRIDVTRP